MTIETSRTLDAAARERIAAAIDRPGRIVVLTGAGISAESGISTYRGKGGRWTEGGVTAMNRATMAFFMRYPHDAWRWNLGRRTEMAPAAPNHAHDTIARAEAALGDRFGLITQNIDRLHLAAGSTPARTIEIHGHLHGMRCSAGCDGILPVPDHFDGWDDTRTIGETEMDLLTCPDCGFATRPHVLWFDEMYDETNYRARTADSWVAEAALCISVGTSGEIGLAPRLATIAHRAGALLVDVNPHPNELRRLAEDTGGVVVDAPASVGVAAVVGTIVEAGR
jgi:NAD-dependent deacetylase